MLLFCFSHWYNPASGVFLALKAADSEWPILLASESSRQSNAVSTDLARAILPLTTSCKKIFSHGIFFSSSLNPRCSSTISGT